MKGAIEMNEYYSKVLVSSVKKAENELEITLKAVQDYSVRERILWANEENIEQAEKFEVLKVENVIAKAEFEALLLHAYSNQTPVKLCLSKKYKVKSVMLA